MKRRKSKAKYNVIIFLVIFTIIYVAVVSCSNSVEQHLKSEMQQTLCDIAEQNVQAVRKELVSQYRVLNAIALDLQSRPDEEDEILRDMAYFTEVYNFKRMGYIHADGTGITTDGYEVNLSHRDFFQKGMEGEAWLTGTLTDGIGDENEPINVFSVPLYNAEGTEVKGVLFATYRNGNFQELVTVDFLDGQGYSCIIRSDGSVVAHSTDSPIGDVTNVFDQIRTATEGDESLVNQLRSDIENANSGIVTCEHKDGNPSTMFYYTPLNDTGASESWYLLEIVPLSLVNERMAPIMDNVDRLTLIVVCVTTLTLFIFFVSGYIRSKKLERLAYQDSLTGGDNFEGFKAASVQIKDKPGYVLAMDLAGFRLINDTQGLDKGDETIVALWEAISGMLKDGEIAARVEAERFVIFLKESGRSVLEERLRELEKEIEKIPERIKIPRIFPVIGIYHTQSFSEPDKALGYARMAKKVVKGRRDRYFAYYDEINSERMTQEQRMEERFEDALKNGEFEVWYQPKYDPADGNAIGAEALIRWREDGKLLSPGVFIPLFEQDGSITVLDEYVFRTVCAQQSEWVRRGCRLLPVSVNISRVSLYYPDIVEKYRNILDSYGLDIRLVQLEITESATVDNKNIAELVEHFHDAGFTMLLDDFGSGYSALTTLSSMRFDVVKLDKSLIDGIGSNSGETLLKYIVRLGQNLGMSITAEGVETDTQMRFVRDLHCNDIQGYFYSKPLQEKDYEASVVCGDTECKACGGACSPKIDDIEKDIQTHLR